MPWKKQYNKTYYVHNRRVDGKVVSEYFGNKLDAVLASKAHQKARELEQARRERDQAELDELARLTALYDQYAEMVRLLTHATLLANGYHLHKRQWRKKRVTTKSKPNPTPNPNQTPIPPHPKKLA